MIKVLIVSSEGVPFAKTGGLGDVIGSLPKNLVKEGIDARVIIPMYKTIPAELRNKIKYKANINVKVGWRNQYCGILESTHNGVKFYFIDNEYYFGRDGLYGYMDDAERFTFFCRAVLEILPHIDFFPDIIHCNDWHSGMIPVFLKDKYCHQKPYRNIRTLFTIHNLQYQGIFPKSILSELLELSDEYFTSDKLEFHGNINFLKGGLVYSDLISTVSPTYANEIQYPYLGENLDGFLTARSHDISGILNGIDYDEYNPSEDPCIFSKYNMESLEKKAENKLMLQKQLGLDISEDIPLIGLVSRLVPPKGLDLITSVFNEIIDTGAEFVLLGTGDYQYESYFAEKARYYNKRVSANIMFDNTLAHRIYAGADMFLMPSRFEPCGLGQIIALRYGTVPIVHETGGLKDTIQPYNEFTGSGNGFSFSLFNEQDMLDAVKRAVGFYKNKSVWNKLMQSALSCDFSWGKSAKKYIEVYSSLVKSYCKIDRDTTDSSLRSE